MFSLVYLLRIWEKTVKIPNPSGIREKRQNSRSLLLNLGELTTMIFLETPVKITLRFFI